MLTQKASPPPARTTAPTPIHWRSTQTLRLLGLGRLSQKKRSANVLAQLEAPSGSHLLGHYEVKQKTPSQLQLPGEYKKRCTGSWYVCLNPKSGEQRSFMLLFPESTYAWLEQTRTCLEEKTGKTYNFAENLTQITPKRGILGIPKGPLREALRGVSKNSESLIFAGEGAAIAVWHPEEFQAFVQKMQAQFQLP